MSQSPKGNSSQGVLATARRGRAGAAGQDALSHAAGALARAGFADPSLVLRWAAIAGHEVARIAQPVKLQEGADGAVLTLKCDAGAIVFVQHQTRALIGKVNAYLGNGRVARLKLVPGRLYDFSEPITLPASRLRGQPRSALPEKPTLSAALEKLAKTREAALRARPRTHPD